MLSESKKLEISKKIITSKTFQKASTSSALLMYLVEADIADSFLKEDIIDIEFFGGKQTTDKSNTRVRVSVYNLRKKLGDYYEGEGKDSEWKLMIDKGQYQVRFEKQLSSKKGLVRCFNKHIYTYVILIILILALFIDRLPDRQSKIWSGFLKSEETTTLFIGDSFGIRGETITGGVGFTRDYNINSVEEFYKFIEKRDDLKDKLKPSNYNYFTNMGAVASKNIAQLFANYKKTFDIRYSSNSTFDDIKSGNAIYIGPLHNKNKFIPIFNDAHPYLQINGSKLNVKGHGSVPDTIFTISFSGKYTDAAIVSRFPGPMGTEQMVFFSNHDIGASATVEIFTNQDSIQNFSNKYLKDHKYFTAIYKVFGKERTSLDLELLKVIPF